MQQQQQKQIHRYREQIDSYLIGGMLKRCIKKVIEIKRYKLEVIK